MNNEDEIKRVCLSKKKGWMTYLHPAMFGGMQFLGKGEARHNSGGDYHS